MAVEIKPIPTTRYHFRQSRTAHAPEVPFRLLVVAPSGQGKTVLLSNLILSPKLYRGCFERIDVWSPSVDIDATWGPVKRYIEDDMEVDVKKEPAWFADYAPADLAKVVDAQFRIVAEMKRGGHTKLPNILVLIDDHADNEAFTRRDPTLWSLFTRGRHAGISTVISGQRLASVAPIIRLNMSGICLFALRNVIDLQRFLEETSAVLDDKDVLQAMHRLATSKPHGFLYVDLLAKSPETMFYDGFSRRLVPGPGKVEVRGLER